MVAESVKTPTADSAQMIDLDDPKLYLNRELSMLEFQRRVMQEAPHRL